MRKLFAFFSISIAAVLLAGCAGTETPLLGVNNPRVRLVNALRDGRTIAGFVANERIGTAVPRGAVSTEAIVTAGDRTVTIRDANSNQLLESKTEVFTLDNHYLLVAYADSSVPSVVSYTMVTEDRAVTFGQAEVSFVRATDDLGDVDVYLVPPGGNPTAENRASLLDIGQVSNRLTVAPGTYTIRVYPAGTTAAPLFTQDVVLSENQNSIFILTSRTDNNQNLFIRYTETGPAP